MNAMAVLRRLSLAGLSAVVAGLLLLRPALGARPAADPIEIRHRGHDPASRWSPGGALSMVFVRDDPEGSRLYYADSSRHSLAAVPVSPAGSPVVGQSQTGPSLEFLPNGAMVTFYSVSNPTRKGSGIRAQRSTDGGDTWSAPVAVNDDQSPGHHGWLSTAVDASGRIQIAWLDNRGGEQGLSWTRTSDGARYEPNRVVDPRVCFCCATDVLAAPKGGLWIAYRDLKDKDLRNIAIVAAVAGDRFSAPVVVSDDGWRINGCPDSGPRMALDGSGGVWAAWFNGAAPGVFAAFSTDSGSTFSKRIQIAGPAPDGAVPNHPDIAVLPDGRVISVYVSRSTVYGSVLQGDRKSWGPAVPLVAGAAEPRIVSRRGRRALSYTARDGNELLAVAETKSLEGLIPPR